MTHSKVSFLLLLSASLLVGLAVGQGRIRHLQLDQANYIDTSPTNYAINSPNFAQLGWQTISVNGNSATIYGANCQRVDKVLQSFSAPEQTAVTTTIQQLQAVDAGNYRGVAQRYGSIHYSGGSTMNRNGRNINTSVFSSDGLSVVKYDSNSLSATSRHLPQNVGRVFVNPTSATFVYNDGRVLMKPVACLDSSESQTIQQLRLELAEAERRFQEQMQRFHQNMNQNMQNLQQSMQNMQQRLGQGMQSMNLNLNQNLANMQQRFNPFGQASQYGQSQYGPNQFRQQQQYQQQQQQQQYQQQQQQQQLPAMTNAPQNLRLQIPQLSQQLPQLQQQQTIMQNMNQRQNGLGLGGGNNNFPFGSTNGNGMMSTFGQQMIPGGTALPSFNQQSSIMQPYQQQQQQLQQTTGLGNSWPFTQQNNPFYPGFPF